MAEAIAKAESIDSQSEEWRVCPYNDNYQVSSIGRVRRATFSPNRKSKPGDIIQPNIADNGYAFVGLWNDGQMSRHSVHRLVACAFLGMPPTKSHEVAHNDGVRAHNTVRNLRWATRKENHADKAEHGTQQHGENNGHSKLTASQVREILQHPITCNRSALARKYGVSHPTITRIIKREIWKHVDLKEIA
jgi:flavin-binding protein dodecin